MLDSIQTSQGDNHGQELSEIVFGLDVNMCDLEHLLCRWLCEAEQLVPGGSLLIECAPQWRDGCSHL